MKNIKYLEVYETRINGIPVTLHNVPYKESWGSKEILVNFHSKKLENDICKFLLDNRPQISGGILKFIRSYLNMSLQKMNDEYFNKTKTTIAEWEKNVDKSIPISSESMTLVYNHLLVAYCSNNMKDLMDIPLGEEISEKKPLDIPQISINAYTPPTSREITG